MKSEWVDLGYTSAPRVYQLKVNDELEPEILVVINAGKAVNEQFNTYYVLREDAFNLEPNGKFEIMKHHELEKVLGCELNKNSETDDYNKILNKEIDCQICCYSETLKVIRLTEDDFETIGPFVIGKPVDVDFIKTKNYFSVMTNVGLIIFKKIVL